jgi:hypothetical protein
VRELGEADITVAAPPDTHSPIEGRNLERFFHDQTKWSATTASDNIVGVIHNGDVINNEPQIHQWEAVMRDGALEGPEADLPDGMPYGVSVGNHDNSSPRQPRHTDRFNQYTA